MERRVVSDFWRSVGGAATRLALTTLAALLVLAGTGGPAAAHTTLNSSTPKDGATVRSLKTITLRFAGPVSGGADSLVITTEDDEPVPLSTPTVTDDTVTAELKEGQAEPGRYVVSYRVRSSDGDSVTGRLTFTVAEPAGAQPSPTSEPPPATATPTPSTAAPAGPSATPAGTESATTEPESGAGPLLLSLGLAVVVLAGVGWLVVSRRRGRS